MPEIVSKVTNAKPPYPADESLIYWSEKLLFSHALADQLDPNYIFRSLRELRPLLTDEMETLVLDAVAKYTQLQHLCISNSYTRLFAYEFLQFQDFVDLVQLIILSQVEFATEN